MQIIAVVWYAGRIGVSRCRTAVVKVTRALLLLSFLLLLLLLL
jgi:hypothetical protein